MRPLPYILLLLLLLPACRRSEEPGVLPHFTTLTTADGLSDDHVMHLLPLPDGRMVVTSGLCINLYDPDKGFRQFPVGQHEKYPIPYYSGAYHVYADNEQRLWVKEWGHVWCMDLDSGAYTDLSDRRMDDVFVDGLHRVWAVEDTVVGHDYGYSREWGTLQDLDADSTKLYLFFSQGILACYDLQSHALEYTTAPYDTADAKFYDRTSLVVRGPDRAFYQLRCGERRYVFLRFDPTERTWRTVFETTQGSFHSVCVPTAELALLGCPQGVWEINLTTGEMNLHAELMTTSGDTLRTGINGIVCADDGSLWLATYDHGVLRADSLHARSSYLIYYIVALLALLVVGIGLIFYVYAVRQRRRERRLLQRLRELMERPSQPTQDTDSTADEEKETDAFVAQAIALVEQNLRTPGYGVEQLAADLCMERTGLYKKLTTLLDTSPSLFIRGIRMEHGARLLREGRMSVAEIAEHCGIQSPSYFSRLFQQTYGMKPSEYH